MVLSVTGTTGSITWCGKTWNFPGDSGLQQEVCPTGYSAPFNSSPSFFGHAWTYTGTDLKLERVNIFTAPHNRVVVGTGGTWYAQTIKQSGYTGGAINIFGTGANPPAIPNTTNYKITDEFFGSYTNGSNTYTWSRGTNWPTP